MAVKLCAGINGRMFYFKFLQALGGSVFHNRYCTVQLHCASIFELLVPVDSVNYGAFLRLNA